MLVCYCILNSKSPLKHSFIGQRPINGCVCAYKPMAVIISTRLPCCFMVYYDYPSWRTGGSLFVPQMPGYLKNKSEMRSFKSTENIHKKEDGPHHTASANKASSVTLQPLGNESQRKHTTTPRTANRQPTQRPTHTKMGSKQTTSSPKGNDRSPESNVPSQSAPKSYAAFPPPPMMLHIKLDQD